MRFKSEEAFGLTLLEPTPERSEQRFERTQPILSEFVSLGDLLDGGKFS
jgi:hypothetical protein